MRLLPTGACRIARALLAATALVAAAAGGASSGEGGGESGGRFPSPRAAIDYAAAWRVKAGEQDQPGYADVGALVDGRFVASVIRWRNLLRVDIFDGASGKASAVPITEHKAYVAWMVTPERDGNFLLWDRSIAYNFDAAGNYLGQIVTMSPRLGGEDGRRTKLASGPQGDLYATDSRRRIMRFSRLGHPLAEKEVSDRGEIRGMSFSPDGLLWVSVSGSEEILVLDPDLNLLARFGAPGNGSRGEFKDLGMISASSRSIAVIDQGNRRVCILDRNGVELASIGPGSPSAVAVNREDDVLVLGRKGVSCFRRSYVERPAAGAFAGYVEALGLLERSEAQAARERLAALAASAETPADIRRACERLTAGGPSFASRRHFSAPEPLEADAARALAARLLEGAKLRPEGPLALDPYGDRRTWVALGKGFCAAVDRFDEIEAFDDVAALNGLHALTVSCFAFTPARVWAGTDRGLLSYDRKRRLWRFFDAREELSGAPVKTLAFDAAAGALKVGVASRRGGATTVEIRLASE